MSQTLSENDHERVVYILAALHDQIDGLFWHEDSGFLCPGCGVTHPGQETAHADLRAAVYKLLTTLMLRTHGETATLIEAWDVVHEAELAARRAQRGM